MVTSAIEREKKANPHVQLLFKPLDLAYFLMFHEQNKFPNELKVRSSSDLACTFPMIAFLRFLRLPLPLIFSYLVFCAWDGKAFGVLGTPTPELFWARWTLSAHPVHILWFGFSLNFLQCFFPLSKKCTACGEAFFFFFKHLLKQPAVVFSSNCQKKGLFCFLLLSCFPWFCNSNTSQELQTLERIWLPICRGRSWQLLTFISTEDKFPSCIYAG